MAPLGEPTPQQRHGAPIGSLPLLMMLIICAMVMIVALARQAESVRRVISHRLKNLAGRGEGNIRLGEETRSPSVAEFLDDDSDDGEDLPKDLEDGIEAIKRKIPLASHPDSDPYPIIFSNEVPPSPSTGTHSSIWSV